jgi:transposase-like protein
MRRAGRAKVFGVGVFPNRNSAIRLISMVLIEQTEDWITERSYMSEESMQLAIRNAPG